MSKQIQASQTCCLHLQRLLTIANAGVCLQNFSINQMVKDSDGTCDSQVIMPLHMTEPACIHISFSRLRKQDSDLAVMQELTVELLKSSAADTFTLIHNDRSAIMRCKVTTQNCELMQTSQKTQMPETASSEITHHGIFFMFISSTNIALYGIFFSAP